MIKTLEHMTIVHGECQIRRSIMDKSSEIVEI